MLSSLGGVFTDVTYRTDLVSISLLVFGIIGENELHSGRKDRSVLLWNMLWIKTCQIIFYISDCTLKLYKWKWNEHCHSLKLSTLSKKSVSTQLSTSYIQSTM